MIRFAKALAMSALLGYASYAQTPGGNAPATEPTKAGAYYYFAMGRLYAELAGSTTNQGEYVAKAIQNYKQALKQDPASGIILEELTDIYLQTGRLQDAVDQAQEVLKQSPDNLNARRVLGRIYMRAIPTQGNQLDQSMVRKAIEQFRQVTEKEPGDAESWVVLGRLYRVSEDAAAAEQAYNAALKADPKNDDALTGLAMLYADQGDTDRAIQKLKAATDQNPNARTLAALADAYEREKNYKGAADALKRAVELEPDNARIKAALAQDLLFSDQVDEALTLYQQLAAQDPRDVQLQLRIAEIFRGRHELAKAREALNKAKQLDPNDFSVAYEEVNLLEAEGRFDQATSQLKSMLDSTERRSYTPAQTNSRAMLLKRLGWLYRTAGQFAPAVEAFRQAATLDSASGADSAVLIIDTYRQAKDLPSALREAEAALKKYPDNRAVRVSHAEVLSDQGKIDEAAAEVRALAKDGADRDIQIELAQIYEKGKRWTDVQKALDDAEKLSKTDDEKATVYFMRGAMYERMNKFDLSEAAFRKVLQIDPANAGALNYLGYMLADRNVRLDEAHDLIQKALQIDPQNGAYMDSLGWVYFRQGKLNEAADLLVKALDRVGRDPTVHDHLGDVYFKLGKTKEAIAQWQVSVQEFQKGAGADEDPEGLAKVTKKLESARVRLAQETNQR